MEFSKMIEIPVVFWWCWYLEIENINMSLDVWQQSSVTPMEFSQTIVIPLSNELEFQKREKSFGFISFFERGTGDGNGRV